MTLLAKRSTVSLEMFEVLEHTFLEIVDLNFTPSSDALQELEHNDTIEKSLYYKELTEYTLEVIEEFYDQIATKYQQ